MLSRNGKRHPQNRSPPAYTAEDFEGITPDTNHQDASDNQEEYDFSGDTDNNASDENNDDYQIAEKASKDSQNVFDALFGVTGRKDVEDSMVGLSEAITGNSDSNDKVMNVIEDVSRSVTHPNQPSLRKNTKRAKEALKALINVHISETIGDDS